MKYSSNVIAFSILGFLALGSLFFYSIGIDIRYVKWVNEIADHYKLPSSIVIFVFTSLISIGILIYQKVEIKWSKSKNEDLPYLIHHFVMGLIGLAILGCTLIILRIFREIGL